MTRRDAKLAALNLAPRRVSPGAASFAAAEERAMRLCAERDRGMLHPGFRDTSAPDGAGDDTAAGAFVLVAWLASFACGAVVQAFGGWPAALAVWSASAGAAAWAVGRAVRRGAGP